MAMPVRLIHSNPKVHENAHKIAVMRGPVVYCAEGIDNDFPMNHIIFDDKVNYKTERIEELDADMLIIDVKMPRPTQELYSFEAMEYVKAELRMIPYYCFANRGETEMRVWL